MIMHNKSVNDKLFKNVDTISNNKLRRVVDNYIHHRLVLNEFNTVFELVLTNKLLLINICSKEWVSISDR